MLSNFYKTTSEYWERTPGTQKGSPFSLKEGKTKYKRQKDKTVRDGDPSWGRRGNFQTAENPLTGESLRSFGTSKSNITGRGKKNPTEYAPNCNSQGRSSPDAHICHQQAGVGQGGMGYIFRVSTRPECPEDNQRELT